MDEGCCASVAWKRLRLRNVVEFLQGVGNAYPLCHSAGTLLCFRVEVAALEVNRLAVAPDVFELIVTTLLRHRFDR